MPKKMISMKLDEVVLAKFDRWCAARSESRTAVVERFMDRQADVPTKVKVTRLHVEPPLNRGVDYRGKDAK